MRRTPYVIAPHQFQDDVGIGQLQALSNESMDPSTPIWINLDVSK